MTNLPIYIAFWETRSDGLIYWVHTKTQKIYFSSKEQPFRRRRSAAGDLKEFMQIIQIYKTQNLPNE